jgi:CubicO group peptidase (beta-lactamase class C family)
MSAWPGVSNGIAQDKVSQIDALVQQYHDLRQFNGSVLVAESGKVIYKKGFGYANIEWEVPNKPNTRFRVGSVTKQFTAALVLQLVEQGKLSLDGAITDYLPEYPKTTGDRITIHHLLTHSSGIPNYTSFPDFFPEMSRDRYEPEEFISVFSERDLDFEPGTEWSYSNSGYFLLGVIIERVTGEPYEAVLREQLLEPLGLRDTGYDHYTEVLERRAAGYEVTFTGYENTAYLDTSLPYSAGSLYSTVEDMYLWDQILYSDRLFDDPKTKDLMLTPHIQSYGYGLVIRRMPIGGEGDSVQVIEHGGGINGFIAGFRRLVDDRHLIVLMDNSSSSVGALQRGITNILYGHPAQPPTRSIARQMRETIEQRNLEAGIRQYHELKASEPDAYDFGEAELNGLGYYLLEQGEQEQAIAIFKLNVEAYPKAFNTYDSLGEAYMKAGDRESAIENYRKSLELNPRNENARLMLAELGVQVEESTGGEISLDPEVLNRYVGVYELQPGFTVTVTLEGDQLMARATGQSKFPIFPMSQTRFFLKVVEAEIEFNLTGDGVVESLTLFQGGQELTGKKVE